MKEQMSIENQRTLAAYRYKRANETLAEIPFLKQQGYYNTAINRLYYASLRQDRWRTLLPYQGKEVLTNPENIPII